MEGVGAWPTAACLSPDQSGKAAIDVGAFSVAAAHGSYCGNPGSCPKGERTMKWTLRRRKQRNAELRQEIQAHLLLAERDRKTTRLNSSHGYISYAVFCLKKKNTQTFL